MKTASIFRRQFTIVELLVVIAIIAILAAMLLPTLQRAKYRARLVVCTSNLKQVAITAFMYAEENKEHYPYRATVDDTKYSVPYIVQQGAVLGRSDKELLQSMGLEEIQCPLATTKWTSTTSSIGASYSYYFGWFTRDPECRLLKLGKTMAYHGESFDVLASDVLHHRESSGRYVSSHPDYGTGLMSLRGLWSSSGSVGRGELDLNFCTRDGAVSLLSGLSQVDSRLSRIPYENPNSALSLVATDAQMLPAE